MRRAASLSALAWIILPPAFPQAKKGLDADTLFEMESISNPAISPDGKAIVFARGFVDKVKDQIRTNLWLVTGWTDPSGPKLRELTSGSWRDSTPVWSPDGRRIAFLSDRDGSTQIHVLWVDSREMAQLTRLEKAPSSLRWSPDGTRIAFTMTAPGEDPVLAVKLPRKPEGAQWAKPAVIVDRLSWASDGVGPVPVGYSHIYVVDALTGGTPKQVTGGKYNHRDPAWSPDGRKIYFSAIRKPDAEYLRNDTEIYAVDLDSGAISALTDRKGPDLNPTPKGEWIAYTGYDDRMFTFHVSSIYLMDSAGGRKTLWAGGLPSSPGALQWNKEGSGVYFTMEEQGSAQVFFLPIGGKPQRITSGAHVISQASLAGTGDIAAVRSSFHEPGALVHIKGSSVTKVLDLNQDVLEGRALGQVEELWWASPDGVKVQGWLVKPVDFDPARKYPLVLYIHGGPWSMYSVAFNWAWQNFAANGYAVLYANPRGSTGYGQDFVNGIQYAYPGKDYDDLMAGVDAVLKKVFIDGRNLFVCGGSGGGVLTAWIVGHTGRFRAAVSMRPVIDWHSFVGTTDGAMWYDQFKKRPWEDPLEYAVRSPLHYVANVTTPTMVMTGEADLRTPISQSEEYYRALKLLKKDTLLVRVPEEFHGWRRPSHQLLQQLYLLAWFEKYRIKDN